MPSHRIESQLQSVRDVDGRVRDVLHARRHRVHLVYRDAHTTYNFELEDRVRMLQEMELDRPDADEIDADMRERYRELAETVRAWDTENATLSSGFGSKVCARARCASRIGGTAILVMFDRLCVKRRARSILLRLKATEMTGRPLRNIVLALIHRCWF